MAVSNNNNAQNISWQKNYFTPSENSKKGNFLSKSNIQIQKVNTKSNEIFSKNTNHIDKNNNSTVSDNQKVIKKDINEGKTLNKTNETGKKNIYRQATPSMGVLNGISTIKPMHDYMIGAHRAEDKIKQELNKEMDQKELALSFLKKFATYKNDAESVEVLLKTINQLPDSKYMNVLQTIATINPELAVKLLNDCVKNDPEKANRCIEQQHKSDPKALARLINDLRNGGDNEISKNTVIELTKNLYAVNKNLTVEITKNVISDRIINVSNMEEKALLRSSEPCLHMIGVIMEDEFKDKKENVQSELIKLGSFEVPKDENNKKNFQNDKVALNKAQAATDATLDIMEKLAKSNAPNTKSVLAHLHDTVKMRFNEKAAFTQISSAYILRYCNPMITVPVKYKDGEGKDRVPDSSIVVMKIVQNIANKTLPQESDMKVFNDYVTDNYTRAENIVNSLIRPPPDAGSSG